MQLVAAARMSYAGSAGSGSGRRDELDDDDDGYDDLDEFREEERCLPLRVPPPYDSDEDTEEASETDAPNNDEPLEIKEQMYHDKLASLKKQLQQLTEGSLPEYTRKVKRLEHHYHERLRLNKIYREHMLECADREYVAEKKAAAKEFEEKKVELKENLLSDFEDKRKLIETERHNMELNGDSMEVKPAMTRKLRRRPNEPAPAPEKRRKPPATTLTYLLDERDIDSDLRAISRVRHAPGGGGGAAHPSPPPPPPHPHQPHPPHHHPRHHATSGASHLPPTPRKHYNSTSESMSHEGNGETGGGGGGGGGGGSSPPVEARVEDGKLLLERRWFHRGQSVYVEGRDVPRFSANIAAIGTDAIWVKKSNLEKMRIYTSQLARGKVTIKRRAS